MCGIVALFAHARHAPPIDAAELTAVRDAMAARGPDGAESWIAEDGRVGFGHRRLSIIDLSTGANQPMASACGRLVVTFNGEIYNYRALRCELEAQGARFRTQSDTEVLLHLYARDGEGMVARLRGMYAFALWDSDRRGMLLARDPLGIKPLYYADTGGTLRAASQVKALVAGGRVGRGTCAAGHVGFFLFGHVPEPHTLHADVRALPAGHTLWVDEAGARAPRRFFDVTETLAATPPAPEPIDLGAVLRDSVRHHLVADVPVGVFLSGGLDSTTLAALATEEHGAGLESVTLAFDEFAGTGRDEAPLAEMVAAACATRHTTRRVAGADFAAERDALLAAMDLPTIDGVNTYFVAKATAATGLKVALSGLGGDELFGGYDSFRQIPRLVGALGRVPGLAALGHALRVVAAPLAARAGSPKYAGLLEYGTRTGDAYLLRRGLFMPWELPRVLDPELARAGWRELEPLVRLDAAQAPIPEPRRKVAALETAFYMRNQLLRDADWAGMAHSLEIRTPLVDVDLFRALAPAIGRTGAPTKADAARTPKRALPEALMNRPKTGFFVPVREWLRGDAAANEPGLRGWARQVHAAQWNGT